MTCRGLPRRKGGIDLPPRFCPLRLALRSEPECSKPLLYLFRLIVRESSKQRIYPEMETNRLEIGDG